MSRSTANKTHLFFLVFLTLGFSADGAEIRLKRSVKSQGSLVLLGDIAHVKDEDPDVVETLERIELFPAPAGRRGRTLRVREVRELLRLNGVDLAACKFLGSDTCRITAELKTKPDRIVASKPVTRPKPVDTIMVAARPLPRGRVINESDVVQLPVTETMRRMSAFRSGSVIHHLNDVVGFELTRSISADQPFDARALRRPLLIRRGEEIQVTARASGVTVRTTARATEDGSQGDLVMVQSTLNRQKYMARVTGFQQAEVYASGTVVRGASPRQAADNDAQQPPPNKLR